MVGWVVGHEIAQIDLVAPAPLLRHGSQGFGLHSPTLRGKTKKAKLPIPLLFSLLLLLGWICFPGLGYSGRAPVRRREAKKREKRDRGGERLGFWSRINFGWTMSTVDQ